jgi:hypothetical protein
MADDKPMIEVGITASIDQLQKALQKAEGQVKSASEKMAQQAADASAKLEAKLAQQAAAMTKASVKQIASLMDQLDDAKEKSQQQAAQFAQKSQQQAAQFAQKMEAAAAQSAQKTAAITKASAKQIAALQDQLDDAGEKTKQQAAQFAQRLEAASSQSKQQAAQFAQKMQTSAAQSKQQIAGLKAEMDKFRIVNEAFRNDAAKPMPQQVFTSGQKPAEEAGSSAGAGYLRQFNGVIRATGVGAIARALTEGFSGAALEISRGNGADVVAQGFIESLQKSLKSIPVAGDLGQAIEDLVYGDRARQELFDKLQQDASRIADEAIATREKQQQRLQKLSELRARTMEMQEERVAGPDETAQMRVAATREQRKNEEEIKRIQQEIIRQDDLLYSGPDINKAAILDEIKLLKQEQAAYRDRNAEIEEGFKAKMQELKFADEAEQRERDRTAAAKAAKDAADAAAAAAKAKSESEIKALEQSGKAREGAIAAQIAALQGQSPAARTASISALTQQFAGNMGGDIQTALGTFRSGGSAVAERAFEEAKAQTEKQEKIVQLQEEMKRLHEETNRKIDAMKGAA